MLAYVVYASLFIYSCSITIASGERYFVLFDDAMISMRYAYNLAHGAGLVWNPGEQPVEGFTNLLWTLYMSIFHLLPIPESRICLAIHITGVFVQLATIFLVKKISVGIFGKESWLVLLPVVLTAFYLPLNNWSLQGMEVGVLALLLTAAAFVIQECLATGKSALIAFILFWFAIFVRMDSVVPLLGTTIFLFLFDKSQRMKHLIQGGIALGSSLGLLELFRYGYYHDLLPNTYYLKVTGYPPMARVAQGLFNVYRFVVQSNPWLFAIAAFGVFKERAQSFTLYLAMIVAGQFAYSSYVGGDAWEAWGNRYITQAIPLFFIIFACGIRALSQIKLKAAGKLESLPAKVAVLIALIALPSFNNVPGLRNLILLDHPISWEPNKNRLELALSLKKVVLEHGHIAATLCGILPYYVGRNCIDILGKCDTVVAKEDMHSLEKIAPEEASSRWFYPGHMKWDYKHSIGDLAPDVVVELWALPQDAQPYLEGKYKKFLVDGFPVFLKLGSPNIDWKSPLIKELPQ